MRRLRRVRFTWSRLTWRERGFVLASPPFLLASDLSLRLLGYARARSLFAAVARLARPSAPASAEACLTRRAQLLRAVALRMPFRSDCLRQSLLLWAIAHRWNLPAEIRFGVDESAENFGGHAWTEIDDQPVWPEDPALPRTLRLRLP